MSIENKLNYLSTTKNLIKEAIKSKGVSVLDTDPFRDYANKINLIESGLPYTKANISSVCNGNDLYEVYDVVIDINGVQHTIPGVLGELIESGSSKCENSSIVGWTSKGSVQLRINSKTLSSLNFNETVVNVDLSEYDETYGIFPVTDIYHMFYNQTNLLTVTNVPNMYNVDNAIDAFNNCTSLTSLPRLKFGNRLTDMNGIFDFCTLLESVDFSGSDFSGLVLTRYTYFSDCKNLHTMYFDDVIGLKYVDTTTFINGRDLPALKTIYARGADTTTINTLQAYINKSVTLQNQTQLITE